MDGPRIYVTTDGVIESLSSPRPTVSITLVTQALREAAAYPFSLFATATPTHKAHYLHRVMALAPIERAAKTSDVDTLRTFTRDVLHLNDDEATLAAVAEVLWEGNWIDAYEPEDYIRTAAKRVRWQQDKPPRSNRIDPAPLTDSLESVLADAVVVDPYLDVETRLDIERAVRLADLDEDAYRLLLARLDGATRDDAPAVLGWTAKKGVAVWKKLYRNRDRLRDNL